MCLIKSISNYNNDYICITYSKTILLIGIFVILKIVDILRKWMGRETRGLVRVWRHPSFIHDCCKFPENHLHHLLLFDFSDVIELIVVNGNTETFQEVVITKHIDHYFCGNEFTFLQCDMKLLLNDMNTFWFISFHSDISKRWVSAHNKYYNNMVKTCVICCIEKTTPSYPFVSW